MYMITDSLTCRPQKSPAGAGRRYPTKTAGALSYGCCHKDRLMSENLSDTENDERPENDAHNEHEEDRLTSRPFLLCRV